MHSCDITWHCFKLPFIWFTATPLMIFFVFKEIARFKTAMTVFIFCWITWCHIMILWHANNLSFLPLEGASLLHPQHQELGSKKKKVDPQMVNPQLHPGKFTRMPKMMVCKKASPASTKGLILGIYPSLKLTVRPWKMVVGSWKMILSYWEVVTFQGPNFVQLREGIGLYIQFPERVDPPVSPDPFQHLDLHLPKLFWPTARWNATSPVDVSPDSGQVVVVVVVRITGGWDPTMSRYVFC